MEISKLHKRVFEISYKYKLSHVGSCIGSVDLINTIYNNKKENDIFILSCGHAAIALYVVLEEKFGINAEYLFLKHGVHPNRNLEDKLYCSTGSLGMGITVACGLALANKYRNIYCLISDGESFEGSVLESLRFKSKFELNNLIVFLNSNGYSAYDNIDSKYIKELCKFYNINEYCYNYNYSFLNNLDAHYHIITEEEWNKIKNA